jgi:sulfite exporter TauE/SafE
MTTADLGAALLLGLAGAGHCLGMCGGIALALRPDDRGRRSLPVAYHLGRVLSYTLLGGFIGGAAGAVGLAGWTVLLRVVAALLLLSMGLHILNVWRGVEYLERLGARLWQPIAPLARRLLPPRHPGQALLLGALWGLMPCGLIYSALGWAAASGGSAPGSAVLMLLFGVGTLPAMLGTTLLGQRAERFLRNRHLKQVIGLTLTLAGLWTLLHTLMHWQGMVNGGSMSGH